MNTKIVLFLLLPLLIIGWVTPTNTTNEKRTDKGKGLQRSAEGSAFSAYRPQGKEEIKSPLSVKSAFRPYKQKDNGKNAEQQRADVIGDNEKLQAVAAENVDEQRAYTTGDNELLQTVATGDSEQSRVVAARDDDQHRAVSAGDVDLQRVDAVVEPMEVSADGSRSAQKLKPSGGGDGSTSSRRKSGGHQSPLGQYEDMATLSADKETAGKNGGAENEDHEMGERGETAYKKTPKKRRLIKQKAMEKSSKRSAAEKKKNVDNDPSTRQHLVQILQQQQTQQHQFQLSPPLQRVNNPGLSINPVRMITSGQLIANRQQSQAQLQQQQQEHLLMASPPAARSSSLHQRIKSRLSPISNARRAKEQQRKQQHDAGTSSGSVAGEVQQQWQQPQGQSNQVGTSGAGPSGYSGDQQQQIQHLRMSANVGGNLVESQRRHSRVEKAKQIAITSAASDDNQINNVEKIVVQAIRECIKKTLTKYGINPGMFGLSLASNDELTNKYLNVIESNVDHPADIIGELRTFFQQNNGGGDEATLIVQILDEISMEIDNFDSNWPSSSNSASPGERAAHHQKKRFLFANYRLYHQLSKLMSATAQQLKDGLREAPTRFQQLHKLVTAMDKGFRQILEKFEKQNGHDESVNWCSNLFRLEDAIESAKLALLIAFPPNSLNEWIKNGGKWKMLNDIVDEGKFNEFLAYYDDKASAESNFTDKIQKYSENEYYGMFSEFEVNYLRNLANQITQNAFVVKPLTVQTNIHNLTITLAILQKIIGELGTNPNVFILDSLKSDKEIATNFLHLCVSLLDAKFEHFQNQVLARLNEFDRIRKGILDG